MGGDACHSLFRLIWKGTADIRVPYWSRAFSVDDARVSGFNLEEYVEHFDQQVRSSQVACSEVLLTNQRAAIMQRERIASITLRKRSNR